MRQVLVTNLESSSAQLQKLQSLTEELTTARQKFDRWMNEGINAHKRAEQQAAAERYQKREL